MTVEEAKKVFDEFRAQGQTDDEILAKLYMMFSEDKMDLDDLEKLAGILGYEFTDEFKAMSLEDKKTKGYREVDEAAEGIDEETIEDAKELEEGEETPIDDDKGKDDKEDEEKKARKLFGFDK